MNKPLERVRNFRPSRMQTIIASVTAGVVVIGTGLIVFSATASASSITHQGSGILELEETLRDAEVLHQATLSGEDLTISAEGEGKSLCFVAVTGEQVTDTLACGVVLRNGAMAAKYETLPVTWEPAEQAEGAFIGRLASDTFTGKSSVEAGSELRRPDGKQAISPDALNSGEEDAEEVEVLPSSPKGAVLKDAEIVENTSREITHTTLRTPGAEQVVRIGTSERVSTPEGEKVTPTGERIIYVMADVSPSTPGAEAEGGNGSNGSNGQNSPEPDTEPSADEGVEEEESSEGDALVQEEEERDAGVQRPHVSAPEYSIEIDGERFPITSNDLAKPLPIVVRDDSSASLIVSKDEVEQEVVLTDSPDAPLGSIVTDNPAADSLYGSEQVTIESTSRMEYDAFLTEGSVSLAMNNLTVAAHTDRFGWANGGQHTWLIATVGHVGGHPSEAPAFSFSPEMMTWAQSSAKADGVSLGAPRVVRDEHSSAVILLWAAPLDMEDVSIIARPTVQMEAVEEFEGVSFTVPEHIAEPFDFTVTRSSASSEEAASEDLEEF